MTPQLTAQGGPDADAVGVGDLWKADLIEASADVQSPPLCYAGDVPAEIASVSFFNGVVQLTAQGRNVLNETSVAGL